LNGRARQGEVCGSMPRGEQLGCGRHWRRRRSARSSRQITKVLTGCGRLRGRPPPILAVQGESFE
jgi:hypothetical protein